MASGYQAQINIAVKGAKELRQVQLVAKDVAKGIKELSKDLVKLNDVSKRSVPSFNNFNRALARQQTLFNKTVIGTRAAVKAAENLVAAERLVTREIQRRKDLLAKVRGDASQPFGPKQFAGQSSSIDETGKGTLVGQRVNVQKRIQDSLDGQERLQKALLRLETKSTRELEQKWKLRVKNRQELETEISKLRQVDSAQYKEPIGPRQRGRSRGGTAATSGTKISGRDNKSAVTSGLISGAFPLLFGQGPLGGAAGFAGGFAGTKIAGQMGGFAGGLVATSALTAIQQALAGVNKLGQAMSSLVPDIDALINSMGQAGTAEGIRLKVIEQARGKQAALNAAMKNMTRIVGEKGVKGLQEWGEASKKLSESWSRFMLKMGAGFARLLNWADKLFGISKAADRGKARDFAATSKDENIQALFKELRAAERASSGSGNWGGGISSLGKRSVSAIEKDLFGADGTGGAVGAAQEVENQKELKRLHSDLMNEKLKENELLKAKLAGNYEEKKLAQDIAAEVKRRSDRGITVDDQMKERIKKSIVINNKLKEEVALMEKIKDAWKSITAEITGSIKDGIKGLIKGTATWADMLNNIADKFLDMALNQALYGSILGSGGKAGGGIFGALGLFADGGRPPVGKPSIVGEKGPELFVPSSSGKIIPNHELGGGGSVNVTVNVDASGTDVQGDDSQAKQLGTMLSAAVQAELVKQKRPGGLLAGVA